MMATYRWLSTECDGHRASRSCGSLEKLAKVIAYYYEVESYEPRGGGRETVAVIDEGGNEVDDAVLDPLVDAERERIRRGRRERERREQQARVAREQEEPEYVEWGGERYEVLF